MPSETVPDDWKWTTLGAAADFINGDRGENYPTQSDRVKAGVPFINTGHIQSDGRLTTAAMDFITRDAFERLRSGKIKPGDIVYCLRGSTIGKTARNHYAEGAIASSLVIVRAKANACQEYLYFYLTSPLGKEFVQQHDNGSAQPNLSVASLSKYPLPLPPVAEQRAVAHILGALDDKIELNRRMNETLEAMATTIFKDWFVDFGPTRAKMEGRAAYLGPDHWALFPDRFDDEGKPEGWQSTPLSGMAHNMRATISPSLFPEELFDHYSIPAFDDGQNPVREVGNGILSNKTIVPTGAVLLSKLNPEISRVWLVDVDPTVRSICSTEFLVLAPDVSSDRAVLYCLLTERAFKQRLEGMVTGTSKSHQRVIPDAVLALNVVTAPRPVMDAFHAIVSPMLGQLVVNRAESRTLTGTRDLLLPKLMSGEIRMKAAAKIAETAL